MPDPARAQGNISNNVVYHFFLVIFYDPHLSASFRLRYPAENLMEIFDKIPLIAEHLSLPGNIDRQLIQYSLGLEEETSNSPKREVVVHRTGISRHLIREMGDFVTAAYAELLKSPPSV